MDIDQSPFSVPTVATPDSTQLRSLGRQLGEYVVRHSGIPLAPMALQGVVADLAAGMADLQAPLRDLVSRQSFSALLDHARSSGGLIQRDALIQEISRVYHPDVLVDIEEVLNGFLAASGGIASSQSQSISMRVSSPYPQGMQDYESVNKSDTASNRRPLDQRSPARLGTDQQPKETASAVPRMNSLPSTNHPLGKVKYLLLASIALFPIAISILASQINTSPEVIPSGKGVDENQLAKLKTEELPKRLSKYQSDLKDARLICELDNVSNRFKTLAADAAKLNIPEIKGQADAGAKAALSRTNQIKQPGENEYWEDCSIGVGYQPYDAYTWYYGSEFNRTVFAVARKNCQNPAIKVDTYGDSGLTKKLHSQWLTFRPDGVTGTANVQVRVPASSLPANGSIWWDYNVTCNHSG